MFEWDDVGETKLRENPVGGLIFATEVEFPL
jgi:hypothetical protein